MTGLGKRRTKSASASEGLSKTQGEPQPRPGLDQRGKMRFRVDVNERIS
jgi:hypothetical protein